ncbi:unnamed protein product [Gadus morhua 'NCC']
MHIEKLLKGHPSPRLLPWMVIKIITTDLPFMANFLLLAFGKARGPLSDAPHRPSAALLVPGSGDRSGARGPGPVPPTTRPGAARLKWADNTITTSLVKITRYWYHY